MKVLHTADIHFKSKRIEECKRISSFMVDYVKNNNIDLTVIAGDLFDKNAMINSPEFRAAVDFVSNLSKYNQVIIIRGNHDPNGSLEAFSKFRGLKYDVDVFNELGFFEYLSLDLLAIPYFNPASISGVETAAEMYDANKDLIIKKINEFAEKKTNKPKLVIAHISVQGAELANSEKISRGEVMLSVDDFKLDDIDAVMLGHIHQSSQALFKDKNIRYCGAPYRTNFGEKNNTGFFVWDLKKGNTTFEFVDTPSKEMISVEWDESQIDNFIKSGDVSELVLQDDAELKLTINIPEGRSHLIDKEKLKQIHPNINIGINVIPTNEVSNEEVLKTTNVFEKFSSVIEAYLDETPGDSMVKKVDYMINRAEAV